MADGGASELLLASAAEGSEAVAPVVTGISSLGTGETLAGPMMSEGLGGFNAFNLAGTNSIGNLMSPAVADAIASSGGSFLPETMALPGEGLTTIAPGTLSTPEALASESLGSTVNNPFSGSNPFSQISPDSLPSAPENNVIDPYADTPASSNQGLNNATPGSQGSLESLAKQIANAKNPFLNNNQNFDTSGIGSMWNSLSPLGKLATIGGGYMGIKALSTPSYLSPYIPKSAAQSGMPTGTLSSNYSPIRASNIFGYAGGGKIKKYAGLTSSAVTLPSGEISSTTAAPTVAAAPDITPLTTTTGTTSPITTSASNVAPSDLTSSSSSQNLTLSDIQNLAQQYGYSLPSDFASGATSNLADGGIAALGNTSGYPMSQQVTPSYAVPNQMPTSAMGINAISGMRRGGMAHYDGSDGSQVQAQPQPQQVQYDPYAELQQQAMLSTLSRNLMAGNEYPGAPQQGFTGANGGTVPYGLGSYSDGGRLLKGPGDGVSDSIPASIEGKQPARLADGEFVIPARIVSEIGNGSTDAGARELYKMMGRIQDGRSKTIGKKQVAVNTNAKKYLPA